MRKTHEFIEELKQHQYEGNFFNLLYLTANDLDFRLGSPKPHKFPGKLIDVI